MDEQKTAQETKYGALPEERAKTASGAPGPWSPKTQRPEPRTAAEAMDQREKIARRLEEGDSA